MQSWQQKAIKYTAIILILNGMIFVSTKLNAAPITFNTALPVAKGAFLNREQFIFRQFDNDSSLMNRNLEVNGLVSVLGYGVTPKLAIFAAIPYFDKALDLTMNGQRLTRSSEGFGGFKAPTGNHDKVDNLGRLPTPLQSGTGAWDYFSGMVMTYQKLDYEIDSQLSYAVKGKANSFEAGNEVRADVSFQYRLLPQKLSSDTRSFLYGVLEANLINQDKNRISGMADPNSGGTTLYLSPGIQYVTIKYILEAVVQLPVIQNLHGNALETNYIFTTGFRINF